MVRILSVSLLLILLSLLSQIAQGSQAIVCQLGECKTDTDCESRCCNTPDEYVACGECVEIDEL